MRLLGAFQFVSTDATETPLNQLPAPRLQALLAYLVLHRDTSQPRQQLAFLLWPDTSEAQARNNLRHLLYTLRQLLPHVDGFLRIEGHALQWRADAPCRIDVAEFEATLTQATTASRHRDAATERAALQQAITLYHGDLLPSCHDDWILPERERLRQAYTGALERLVARLESEGETRAALPFVQSLLRHDPLREETYRSLMRLHAACGERAMVRRVYQTCAAVMERELGSEPSEATREAFSQSLRRAPAESVTTLQASTAKTNLPVHLTSFIGRERELTELKALLMANRLLTLTGPGGSGKTRLTLQLAGDEVETYTAGVWLVELATLADATLLTQAIAATLGVREQPGRSILETLLDYLRAKTLLLILDNCEHLIATCAQIAETLLRAAPGVTILASSREALGIGGEIAYRVLPLPLPDTRRPQDLDALAHNDSVRLCVERATTAYPPFRLTTKNAAAIVQICRRLDGIPLAIELAAARVKLLPPEQIAARLDDRFRLLTGGHRTALPRHQTLLALIEWSHELLSDAERVLLRRLAVFAGGFSLEAAQAVCGVDLSEETLDTLARLADKSLIEIDTPVEGVEGRFRLLDTMRQYAREKLLQAGEAKTVCERHLEFFLRIAETAEPKLRSDEQLIWLGRLEAEHDNLRAALAWTLEHGASDQALRLAGALFYYWLSHGEWSECSKWLDEALTGAQREQGEQSAAGIAPASRVEIAHRAKALLGAAWSHFAAFDLAGARTIIEESLRLLRTLGDLWWTAAALDLEAVLLLYTADHRAALACLEESVALARELEDPWLLATCLTRFGYVLKLGGDAARAHSYLEEGIALARRAGDRILLSEGLRVAGSLYYAEGNLSAAASLTAESLALGRAIGSTPHIFLALFQLVIIACLQSDPAQAKRHSVEAWALGKETGFRLATVFALIGFGVADCFSGQLERGVRLLAATDLLFRQGGMNFAIAESEPMVAVYKQALARAQEQLSLAAFEAVWAEGKLLTIEQAMALVTEVERADAPHGAGRGPATD
jgi:non-specific serine/threonine protein kinase